MQFFLFNNINKILSRGQGTRRRDQNLINAPTHAHIRTPYARPRRYVPLPLPFPVTAFASTAYTREQQRLLELSQSRRTREINVTNDRVFRYKFRRREYRKLFRGKTRQVARDGCN